MSDLLAMSDTDTTCATEHLQQIYDLLGVDNQIDAIAKLSPRRLKRRLAPWHLLDKVGDSLLIPYDAQPQTMIGRISSSARLKFGKGNYRCRSMSNGIRVWRLK